MDHRNIGILENDGDELGYMSVCLITLSHRFYFSTVSGTFGGLKGWSVDQMVKLKERCVSVYGSISTWDAADVREAGVAIGMITHR